MRSVKNCAFLFTRFTIINILIYMKCHYCDICIYDPVLLGICNQCQIKAYILAEPYKEILLNYYAPLLEKLSKS